MIDLYRLCADLKDERSPLRAAAGRAISALNGMLNMPSAKTVELISGWKESFRSLYGDVSTNLSSNRKLDQEALLARYGVTGIPEIEQAEAVQRLVFAVQTYFSLLVKLTAWEFLQGEKEKAPPTWEELLLGNFAEQ